MSITTDLKEYASQVGFDLVGITSADPFPEAERAILDRVDRGLLAPLGWFTRQRVRGSADPRSQMPEARSIIALAMSYLSDESTDGSSAFSERTEPRGFISRCARGADYHRVLGDRLKLVVAWLRERAGAGVVAKTYVDKGWLIERAVAERAGLGRYGAHGGILTPRFGSWVFLGEVLTDLPLTPDEPSPGACSGCGRCVAACPTGALQAPGVLDVARCLSYLTIELRGPLPRELRSTVGTRLYGCDSCQEACPANRGALPGDHPEFQPNRGAGASLPLVPLLGLSDREYEVHFPTGPLHRIGRKTALRNAAVALGNQGDRSAVRALARALGDPEPLVREHSAWALGRLGGPAARRALTRARHAEPDDAVRAEIILCIDGLG